VAAAWIPLEFQAWPDETLCDNHTVTAVETWAELGERVREARLALGLSQDALAARLGIDRSAIARIEGGQRQVSALELMRLSETLEVPLSHFVSRPPAAVTSRRRDLDDDADAVSRERFRLDAALEAHARDAEWLVEHDLLARPEASPGVARVTSIDEARELANRARHALGLSRGPLGAMAEVAERFGLFLTVIDQDADGASLLLDADFGVGVIGGRAEPGRRRLTAAHELGHFLVRDEYTSDVGIAASRDEREQLIDAFAAELLLPTADLADSWGASGDEARTKLLRISGLHRVSWSAAIRTAVASGVIAADEARRLRSATPVKGDFLAVLGYTPREDLRVDETGPRWRQAILMAWKRGLVGRDRAIEMLRGAIAAEELPDQEVEPQP
jgi:transcriptional regulator with XRE-family HTH domain/Zn-dependent peptidase ImmA (M78 family)